MNCAGFQVHRGGVRDYSVSIRSGQRPRQYGSVSVRDEQTLEIRGPDWVGHLLLKLCKDCEGGCALLLFRQKLPLFGVCLCRSAWKVLLPSAEKALRTRSLGDVRNCQHTRGVQQI